MGFHISKLSHITMIAGKLASVSKMGLLPGKVMSELELDKGYKCLGILEAINIMYTKIKNKTQKEYYRRVRDLS